MDGGPVVLFLAPRLFCPVSLTGNLSRILIVYMIETGSLLQIERMYVSTGDIVVLKLEA